MIGVAIYTKLKQMKGVKEAKWELTGPRQLKGCTHPLGVGQNGGYAAIGSEKFENKEQRAMIWSNCDV